MKTQIVVKSFEALHFIIPAALIGSRLSASDWKASDLAFEKGNRGLGKMPPGGSAWAAFLKANAPQTRDANGCEHPADAGCKQMTPCVDKDERERSPS
jgi:hypothetical protein